jgi:hypothetical protein
MSYAQLNGWFWYRKIRAFPYGTTKFSPSLNFIIYKTISAHSQTQRTSYYPLLSYKLVLNTGIEQNISLKSHVYFNTEIIPKLSVLIK